MRRTSHVHVREGRRRAGHPSGVLIVVSAGLDRISRRAVQLLLLLLLFGSWRLALSRVIVHFCFLIRLLFYLGVVKLFFVVANLVVYLARSDLITLILLETHFKGINI